MSESSQVDFSEFVKVINTTFKVGVLKTVGQEKIIELILALLDWNNAQAQDTCLVYTSTWLYGVIKSTEKIDCTNNVLELLKFTNLLRLRIIPDKTLDDQPWLKQTPTLFHILAKDEVEPIPLTYWIIKEILDDNLHDAFRAVLGLFRKFLFKNKERIVDEFNFYWKDDQANIEYSLSGLIIRKNKEGKNAIELANSDGKFKQFLEHIRDNIEIIDRQISVGGKVRHNTKVKTDKRVKINGRMRVVYRGARGAEYIKNKDIYVRI